MDKAKEQKTADIFDEQVGFIVIHHLGNFYLLSEEDPKVGELCHSRYGVQIFTERMKEKLDEPPVFSPLSMKKRRNKFKVVASSAFQDEVPMLTMSITR